MIKSPNQSGFTLLELIIAMVLAGLMLGFMVMAFTGQSRSYNTQQDISTLQEDMWAALQLMSRDIRMAGYDPTGKASSKTLPTPDQFIVAATSTSFHALQDINGNEVFTPSVSNPEEEIAYSFATPAPGSTDSLYRATNGDPANGGKGQPVIDNLTHVGFDYRIITKTGSNSWAWAWKTAGAITAADYPNIRVVKVCMQGRTARQTSTATDTSSFSPPLSNAPDWKPSAADAGRYQFRTMCVEIQNRNFID